MTDDDTARSYIAATAVVVVIIATTLGPSDFERHQIERENYCTMVSQWRVDEMRGIAEHDRRGWPDYRGEYDSMCKAEGEQKRRKGDEQVD